MLMVVLSINLFAESKESYEEMFYSEVKNVKANNNFPQKIDDYIYWIDLFANKNGVLVYEYQIVKSLNQKQITERHARAMLSLNEEKQQEVLREVLKKKLTVADTERLIKKEPKPKKKKASADVKKTISRNVKIALNTLQQAIGMIEKTGTSLQQETEDLEDEYVITIRIHK